MKSRFQMHLHSHFPALSSQRVLVAVSGGVDSMVLLDLLREYSDEVAIAHGNFQLRGQESAQDEQLVESYCKRHQLTCHIKRFDTKLPKQSTQMAARTLRYNWFEELCLSNNYDAVLTAHHANDNIETLLMNIIRGTGIEGLTGIPEQNGRILRPLLPFHKSEIVAYAQAHHIPWREDRSNQSDDYQRNAIRHHVIPELAKLHPKALENTTKTIDFTKEAALVIQQQTIKLREQLFQNKKGIIYIPIQDVKAFKPLSFWSHQLFHPYGFGQREVIKLLNAQKGKCIHSTDHTLEVGRNELLLYKSIVLKKEVEFEVYEHGIDEPIELLFSKNQKHAQSSLTLDATSISFPMKLRKWKKGDHFYPTGMTGSKKVAKYFKDEKYTATEKAAQWLLCSGNDIVWIVGKRADRRFVSTETTIDFLNISLK
ncbi:MAG: tRNA lysidine(34) synthetase TilS [Flavobacteriaceae bacterium]|nr:tRNA lysidine(34) synthetase TilS [Flavobacteriaceae bacterium]